MRAITAIYWARFALGVIAGLLCTLFGLASGTKAGTYDLYAFLNGITVALLIYLISYYLFRAGFGSKVEKPSKLMTMGIGIYFFTWIFSWAFFFTLTKVL